MVDLEEIQCPLCKEQFSAKERIPLLLPNCGHSYCLQCIEENSVEVGFKSRHSAAHHFAQPDEATQEESLTGGVDSPFVEAASPPKIALAATTLGGSPNEPQLTFVCPEDEVECNFNDPSKLPKNFAMLKVLERHQQAQIKTVQAEFSNVSRDFVVTETPQHSLTKFLSEVSVPPPSTPQETPTVPLLKGFGAAIADLEESKSSKNVDTAATDSASNRVSNRTSQNFHDRFAKAKAEIQKKQEEQLKKAVGFCREHKAPKELVCLSGCQTRVCPHCALFGVHQGHDVREEQEVVALINEHSNSLNQMLEDMKSAQQELSEPKYYWQFVNKYRESKEQLKAHIQNEFRAWRKSLRALEMKILDELHHTHYACFETKFQAAKQENQRMLLDVTNLISSTSNMLNDFSAKSAQDKHHVDFKLANEEIMDLILTKAEAQLDSVLKWREFKSLEGLDTQYSKIQVIFDPAFEAVAEKLCTINGWQKKDAAKIDHKNIIVNKADLSSDMNAQQYSFDSQGRSLEGIPPDISRISFENDQTNNSQIITSGGQIKPAAISATQDVILHSSMEETGCGSNPGGNVSSDVLQPGQRTLGGGISSSNDSDSLVDKSDDRQNPQLGQSMFSRSNMNTAKKQNPRLTTSIASQSPRAQQTLLNQAGPAAAAQNTSLTGGAVASSLPPMTPKQSANTKASQSMQAKKVSKGSAIGIAFRQEVIDGRLCLAGKGIGDQQINEIIKNLKVNSYMFELDLSGNRISDTGVQHLAKAICDCQIESLNLSNNKISEKCMEPLAATLRFAKGLKNLNLEGNGITNRVAKNKLKNSLTWMNILL